MNASEVKERLRARHPAVANGARVGERFVGAWTCLEEWNGIDLLAVSAHQKPASGGVSSVPYPRVGYEVKVSRSDFRREVLRPHKRGRAVLFCNAFYFAVPTGLLTADELAFAEPAEWTAEDFVRAPCPNHRDHGYGWGDGCWKGKVRVPFVGPLEGAHRHRWKVEVPCAACGGKGHGGLSRVEHEAPTLWVPPDVGLVEVDGRGCRITRAAPVRREVPPLASGRAGEAALVRWTSARPDPRHRVLSKDDVLLAEAG